MRAGAKEDSCVAATGQAAKTLSVRHLVEQRLQRQRDAPRRLVLLRGRDVKDSLQASGSLSAGCTKLDIMKTMLASSTVVAACDSSWCYRHANSADRVLTQLTLPRTLMAT